MSSDESTTIARSRAPAAKKNKCFDQNTYISKHFEC
jgi:hypothetical protein